MCKGNRGGNFLGTPFVTREARSVGIHRERSLQNHGDSRGKRNDVGLLLKNAFPSDYAIGGCANSKMKNYVEELIVAHS